MVASAGFAGGRIVAQGPCAVHLNVIGDYGELTTAAAADGVGFEHAVARDSAMAENSRME